MKERRREEEEEEERLSTIREEGKRERGKQGKNKFRNEVATRAGVVSNHPS